MVEPTSSHGGRQLYTAYVENAVILMIDRVKWPIVTCVAGGALLLLLLQIKLFGNLIEIIDCMWS